MNLAFIMFLMDLFKRMGALPNDEKPANPVKTRLYANHYVSNELLKVKTQIEESGNVKSVAYQDILGVWTIGIGIVNVFDYNGNFVLKVSKGLTLNSLKTRFGKVNLSDLEFCYDLMRNHIKASKSKNIFRDLDNNNIPYDENLANAIVDFNYNSGSAYGNSYYYNFIQKLKTENSLGRLSKKVIALAYFKYRMDYLSSLNRKTLVASWVRRTQIFSDRIWKDSSMDNFKSWKIYPNTLTLRNYVVSNYMYVFKKSF